MVAGPQAVSQAADLIAGIDVDQGVRPGHTSAFRIDETDAAAMRRLHRALRRLLDQEVRALYVATGIGARRPLTDIELEKLRVGLSELTQADLRRRLRECIELQERLTRGSAELTAHLSALARQFDDPAILATLRREFIRAATTWTDEEWMLVDAIRETQAKHGARAAMLVARKGLQQLARKDRAAQEVLERLDDELAEPEDAADEPEEEYRG